VPTQGGDYTSSNPNLTVAALQQKLQELTTANDAVANNLTRIAQSRRDRQQQYQQMAAIAAMLKDYASSQYGNRSPQYKSLTALGI